MEPIATTAAAPQAGFTSQWNPPLVAALSADATAQDARYDQVVETWRITGDA